MKNKIKISLKLLKPFKNIFFVVTLIFIFWMLFFDANSWLVQRELNKEIKILDSKKEFYINEIKKDLEEKKFRNNRWSRKVCQRKILHET